MLGPKENDGKSPIPEAWRPTLSSLVDSLARRDALIGAGLPNVDPASPELSTHCHDAVDEYGDVTLVPLPEKAWDSSVAVWWGDDRWECLVDLWTAQEGRSDLVLHVNVVKGEPGYQFSVYLVYVP